MTNRLLPFLFSHGAVAIVVAIVVAGSGSLAAQDALERLSLAEQALAAGRGEESLLHLMAARELLAGAPAGAATAAAKSTLETLEGKADVALEQRRAACATAAKNLLELARAYKSRRWLATAVDYAERAFRLDPAAAERELQQLRKQTGTTGTGRKPATAAVGKAGEAEGIGALGRGVALEEWKLAGGVLLSPSPPPTTYSPYYLTTTQHADECLSVAIDVGNRDAMAGMIFGAKDATDYFILDMSNYADSARLGLRLYYFKEPGLQLLSEGDVDLPGPTVRERRLEVRIRGAQIEGFVDGKRGILCDGPRVAHGLIGFYVSAASARKEGAVPFHDFLRAPLPAAGGAGAGNGAGADPGAADAQAARSSILATVAQAEQDLQQKQPEAAVGKLLAARRSCHHLDAGVLRDGLLESIDKLLSADPLRARRDKAEAEAAKALADLAVTYGNQSFPRVALDFALLASELDPGAHLPLVATYTALVEKKKER